MSVLSVCTMRGIVAGSKRGRAATVEIHSSISRPFVARHIQVRIVWRPRWWRRAVDWYCGQVEATGADVIRPFVWQPQGPALGSIRFGLKIADHIVLASAVIGAVNIAVPILLAPEFPLTVIVTNDQQHAYNVIVELSGTVCNGTDD
jgi:hypothetical protein